MRKFKEGGRGCKGEREREEGGKFKGESKESERLKWKN